MSQDLVPSVLEEEPDSDLAELTYQDQVELPEPAKVAKITQAFNHDGTVRKVIRASPSDFARTLLYLDGKRLSFDGREYLRPIYDCNHPLMLLKTARQVEKSFSLSAKLITTSVVIPYSRSLYVSPSHTQTRQFSSEKLKPGIERSPLIKKYLQDSAVSSQVFEKGFTNGSYIFLRSAFRSADRARGIAVNAILALDELQDFLGSEIAVILECTSHYKDSRTIMAGTPKHLDNPIEIQWLETTQNEWLVPCACGKWNFLDEGNIAPTELYVSGQLPPGPVCKKCMRPLYVPGGQWVSFCKGKITAGYRIPQLMVPWIVGIPSQWRRLLEKRDTYPSGQFNNEVLGLSYDSATKPVTREQLMDCCHDYELWDPDNITPETINAARRHQLIGGVDWGEGNDGTEKDPKGKLRNASYTVLTIGTYITPTLFQVMLIKKYTGKEADPDFATRDISRICNTLGVAVIGADWGHGWGVNNTLVRLMGSSRVYLFQYLPKLKQKLKWDPAAVRYMLQRNFIMSEIFFDIKNHFVRFPKWSHFERFAKEFLSIYAEYVDYRKEIKYDHRPNDPDDAFHSFTFCKMAADIFHKKDRRYTMQIDASVETPH